MAKVEETFEVSGRTFHVPTGLFINNEFVPSLSGKKFPTVNPATGKTLVEVYEADKADVDVAVEAAKKAFLIWKQVTPTQRGILLNKLADLIEQNSQELSFLESLDNGKAAVVAQAADLPLTADCLRYYAGWADKIHGKTIDVGPGFNVATRHEPFGVVGQIIPWNFPLLMLAWKWGPALATGNTIVMKTSEKTPLTALKVCELVRKAGFPPGVINVLSGFGPTAGQAIAEHMDIKKVAFTGSTLVGRKILEAAAKSNLKKVSLELGGKSPNIVFADADLESAVKWASTGIFFNHGQCCCAGSRLFVHEDIYDAFVQKFLEAAKATPVGDPFDPNVTHGPLVDEIQFKRVLNFIDLGVKEGATIELGGKKLERDGYFVPPTLFSNVTDDMTIAKEEIFGPVVCAMKFKTIEEVVQRANNTTYGLAAAIHTKDLKTALRVQGELEAGTVWVNCYNTFFNSVPFGGYKESGIGRELGEYGLQEYTQVKSVITNIA
jgi:aldehyde dehydrogenase (NAD+)